MASRKASEHARALSALGASKGGLARKAALSVEERSEIARKAARERWAQLKGLPVETHSGLLKLGDGVPCSVLDNGMRVFSVNGLLRAFGSGAKSRIQSDEGVQLPAFLSAANVRRFISDDLMQRLSHPIEYRSITGGHAALGYEAEILHKICETMLDARAAGALRQTQERVALGAEILMRAFAKVGLIALIDEATGYQYDRASIELQRLLEAYVVEDMRPWVRLFPEPFFRQVYRIHGWEYKAGVTQGPRYVGKFINRYVYERLPPEVVDRLRKLNPVIGKRRRHKHFQFLTEEIGEPTVDRHLASITTLMTVSRDKQHFDGMFRLAFPKPGEQLSFPGVDVPALPAPATEDDSAPNNAVPAAPEPTMDGSVEIIRDSVRERILTALSGGNTIGSGDLAMAVYGNRKEATLNKLRKRMGALRLEGLIESPSKGIWKRIVGS